MDKQITKSNIQYISQSAIKEKCGKDLIEDTLLKNYETYYRLAFCYVNNHFDALDVVQEVSYKAIKKSSSLKNPNYVHTWIYKIVINEAKSLLKRKINTKNIDDVNVSYDDYYENTDLKKALNLLKDPDKTIVILRFFEDLSLDDIADTLSLNVSTIKSKLYRSLKKLKEEFNYE